MVLLVQPITAAPASQAFQEKQVQAVFVYNFTQFVEWPPEAFESPESPIIIGMIGSDSIRPHLERVLEKEKAQNRPLQFKAFRRLDEIESCHILFVGRSEFSELDPILAALRGRHILTVSDMEGFARRGGMVQFRTDKNRVRLTINAAAARAAQLRVSSKLLGLAEVIGTEFSP